MQALTPEQRLLQQQFEDEKERLRRERIAAIYSPAALGSPGGLDRALTELTRRTGADLESRGETPETLASDNMLSIRERLMARNQRAQQGRVPGFKPELSNDEQGRISAALQRSARGGMVDETSPLNNRAGAYNELAARDAARDAKQADTLSRRFQALQATRAPDAQVAETFNVGRSAGPERGKSRVVRTYAERIAGVEDDPSTPMDESLRFRAEWDFGADTPEENQRLLNEKKAAGRASAKARMQARAEKNALIREAFQSKKAEQQRQGQVGATLRQMMGLDAMTGGQTHATAAFLGQMDGQTGHSGPEGGGLAERRLQSEIALKLLGPDATPEQNQMGMDMLRRAIGPYGGPGQEPSAPGTLEEQAAEKAKRAALAAPEKAFTADPKTGEIGGPEQAAAGLISSLDRKILTADEALAEAKKGGPKTLELVQKHIAERDRQLQAYSQGIRGMRGRGSFMSGM